MPRRRTIGRLVALAAMLAGLTLVPSAGAVSVTYTNAQSIPIPDNNALGVFTTNTVPPGRPPIESLEVPDVKLTYPGGHALDMTMFLRNPSGAEFVLIGSNPLCATMPAGSAITFTDAGAGLFGTSAQTCPTGGTVFVKPADARTFAFYKGQQAAGNWDLIVRDPDDAGLPTPHLGGWGLRINYAAMTAQAGGKRQRLRNKLTISASCNSDCSVASGGNARPATTPLFANLPTLFKVTLKKKARKRLAEGGAKARIKLRFTNDLNEIVETNIRVRVVRPS